MKNMRINTYVVVAGLIVVLAAGLLWIVDGAQVTQTPYAAIPIDAQREVHPTSTPTKQALTSFERDAPSFHEEVALASLLMLIRDADDIPLAGVGITLHAHSVAVDVEPKLTQTDGKVAFEGIAAGMYFYELSVPAGPTLVSSEPVRLAGGETRSIELKVPEYHRTVRGRVLDQRGFPVGGLALTARQYHSRAEANTPGLRFESPRTVQTGADGGFKITGLRDGEYYVSTIANKAYLSVTAIVRAGTKSAVLYVTEGRTLQVAGRVTDPTGEPLAGVRVLALSQSGGVTHTDPAGRYELTLHTDTTKDRYLIRFVLRGHRESLLTLQNHALAAQDEISANATLEPFGETLAVFGSLMDRHGAPVAGEGVRLYSPTLRSNYHVLTGADGAFSFTEVAMGADYRLQVRPKGGYRDYLRQPIDLAVDVSPFEVVLESLAMGKVTGRMLDTQGNPVAHLRLWLRNTQVQGNTLEVTGDANGYFKVDQVPAGSVTLGTRSAPQLRISGIQVHAYTEQHVELVLDHGETTVVGRVIDARWNPIAGARVTLYGTGQQESIRSRSTHTTATDANGKFRFTQLGRLPRRLSISAAGYGSEQQMLDRDQVEVEVRLASLGD